MLTLRGDVAWVEYPNGTERILAIAAGHANNTCTQDPGWAPRYDQGMVDFYDVTLLPFNWPAVPRLARIGFLADPSEAQLRSSAVAVHIETLGSGTNERSYAFVADLNGRVWLFDLSTLFITGNPADPANGLTPILPATWPPVSNPPPTAFNDWDGGMNNIEDIEVEVVSSDKAYVYAANGQGGLAVITYVGFDDPNGPMPVWVDPVNQVDTPGDCRGVEFRTCGSGTKTLVVSDYTGGLRIFGR